MRPTTLFDLLAAQLDSRAERMALILGDERVGYRELAERTEAVAAWLVDAGVRPGDRVGIHLRKSIEEVVATLAVARMGGVFVNLHHSLTERQIHHVVADCDLALLFTDRRKADGFDDPRRLPPMVVVNGTSEGSGTTAWAELSVAGSPEIAGPEPDDLAALFYTSGSTGMPKGVMVTHRMLCDGARIVAGYLGNMQEDRVLGLLPLSFDYGMNQLTTMLHVGGTLVLQPVVFPAEVVRTVVEEEVTGLALVPPSWIQLIRYLQASGERMPSLRYVTNSGGRIPTAVLEAMPEVLGETDIYLMYGLTEGFRSTYLPPRLFRSKLGAIGYPIPEVEIFVVDAERGLCGSGEVGELVHRGSLVSLGYWGDEAATMRRIRSSDHLESLIGREKVLFSGDLVHADPQGCLWFDGRRDEMIKSSGFRISVSEIEDPLYGSGLVRDAVAFGVEDAELGQVAHLVVAVEDSREVTEQEVLELCRRKLPRYMVPAKIYIWSGAIPRTSSGKLDRATVIERCRVKSCGPGSDPPMPVER